MPCIRYGLDESWKGEFSLVLFMSMIVPDRYNGLSIGGFLGRIIHIIGSLILNLVIGGVIFFR